MADNPRHSSSLLDSQARWLDQYRFGLRLGQRGKVAAVGDGVAWIEGLPQAGMEELLRFEDGSEAQVFHLGRGRIGAIMLHQSDQVVAGTRVALTGQRAAIGVGEHCLGRVLDPLGRPLDGLPAPKTERRAPLEARAPSILERDFVRTPLLSGCKIVDSMVPIGCGQRQLIIGDAGTGKSALALDCVLAQRGRNLRCVYVLISQKRSAVVATIEQLRQNDALDYSCVVVAEATAMPGLKYLAPFAGCTIAEDWMHAGHDVLVIYDDLSTHARCYRELSLLLGRAPGREAYPGDIFYLHSRLLERSSCLTAEQGGGSMTALPIIETEQGEIASFIPTNLISITDGQIYLSTTLFARGCLPAVDVSRSVSRIGGKAQHPAIKAQAGRMKLDYLQFQELELFTRFGARIAPEIAAKLERGRLLRELLKQERLQPLPPEQHLAWLIAYNEKLFDTTLKEREIRASLQQLLSAIAADPLALSAPADQWRLRIEQALQRQQPLSKQITESLPEEAQP